jgi:hypothetical protein
LLRRYLSAELRSGLALARGAGEPTARGDGKIEIFRAALIRKKFGLYTALPQGTHKREEAPSKECEEQKGEHAFEAYDTIVAVGSKQP